MYYTSLCAIARDEDANLCEWADYHLRTGFEHIYIFDNKSKNPIKNILADFVDHGLVTVLDFPLEKNPQLTAYYSALKEFGKDSVWIGYIDLDEFIVPKSHHDIRDLLVQYRSYGGLAVHWKMFGSGGHKTRPKARVMESYTQVVAYHDHIKTIVQPEKTLYPISPHHFQYKEEFYCVNEDEHPVSSHISYHTSQKIQINHYFYKSLEDFNFKVHRGAPIEKKSGEIYYTEEAYEDFYRQERLVGEYDDSILKIDKICGCEPLSTLK